MENLTGALNKKKILTQAQIVKKIRWAEALEACEQYHNDLMECQKKAMFGYCPKESKLFWRCMDNKITPEKSSQSNEESS